MEGKNGNYNEVKTTKMIDTNSNKVIEKILQTIPCSILKYLNDENYTIEFANNSFLELLGYCRDEVKSLFNNYFINMVYRDDREDIKKQINSGLEKSDTYEVDYRMIHKNGSLIWVRDKRSKIDDDNGAPYFYSIITNINNEKIKEDKALISESYYKTIMEKSGETMFVINIQDKEIMFSDNFIEKFGEEILKIEKISDLVNLNIIHNDDKIVYINTINTAFYEKNGDDNYIEAEIRIKDKCRRYIWCLIKVHIIKDESYKPIKVIGVISDINEVKNENKNLHKMAETDLLTGLHNKITSNNLIEEYILREGENGKGTLFIIDIDNFKDINDNLGHLYGDNVLVEVAAKIKDAFRKGDILGREGGDEFIVFMKDIVSEDIINEKAKALQEGLRLSYGEPGKEYKISGSIGMALYPENGGNFKEIFEKADKALYYSKQEGKDTYHLHDDNDKDVKYINTSRNKFSEIEKSYREDNFTRYIFEILYEYTDIDLAMNRILSLTARYYNISHIYVYEYSKLKNKLVRTYEYCEDGVVSVGEYSHVYERLKPEEYKDLYNLGGVFYCNDIEKLPRDIYEIYKECNIQSVLKSEIIEDGEFKGSIGFADSNKNRLWTQVEIDANIIISKMISIFLLKKRRKIELRKLNTLFKFMLENTTTCNYIVDKETFEIIYIDEQTSTLYGDAKVGEKCYSAIRGNDDICDNCPSRSFTKDMERIEYKSYNEKYDLNISGLMLKSKWTDNRDVYILLQNMDT